MRVRLHSIGEREERERDDVADFWKETHRFPLLLHLGKKRLRNRKKSKQRNVLVVKCCSGFVESSNSNVYLQIRSEGHNPRFILTIVTIRRLDAHFVVKGNWPL